MRSCLLKQTSRAMRSYFIQAQKVRQLVRDDFDQAFSMPHPLRKIKLQHRKTTGVDVILSPTSTSTAPYLMNLGTGNASTLGAYSDDIFTIPASMAGIPAISIPFKLDKNDAATIGIQLMAQYGDENRLFAVATVLEDISMQYH